MAKLSAREKEAGRGFLLDIFVVGGLLDEHDVSLGPRLIDRRSDIDGKGIEALTICKEIQYRLFDFFSVDKALKSLDGCSFFANPSVTGSWKHNESHLRQIKRSADKLAAIIADFCADNQIYWDDVNTNRTTNEMEQYKQTLIGAALWKEECFLSQVASRKSAAATKVNNTAPTRAPRTPRTPGQAPANGYKSSGPQSGNARGLVGQPGDKTVFPAGTTMYGIYGVNTQAKNNANAFALVNPIEAKGASGSNKSINKVFVNSSHGYTDCRCFLSSRPEADAFLQKCQSICPTTVINLQVGKASADPNGYFQVETEFGPVYIQAQKLNELLTQKSEEVASKKAAAPKYEIHDIATFEEAFFRYE
jgi:hypothetical protein